MFHNLLTKLVSHPQDLGLLFNIYPHTAHAKTRHGDRIIKLFKDIFDTIALVGDIPEDAGDELVNNVEEFFYYNTVNKKFLLDVGPGC